VGGLEPLSLDDSLWRRADVGQALDSRDFGALFRLVHKYGRGSQTQIAVAVGMDQGGVSNIIRGRRGVEALEVIERIADGLAMPDAARVRLGLAPKAGPGQAPSRPDGSSLARRTVVGAGVAAAVTPAVLGSVLREAAAEAMDFTREASISAVGSGTIAHLEAVVTDLGRSYSYESPLDRFAVARLYRQRVADLIRGRRTLKEARELHVCAAELSVRLAWLAHDLGSPLTAEAYAIDSYTYADEAGNDELCAWASDAMASIAMYAEQPAKAITTAGKGLRKASRTHPLSIRLQAQAARAHARLGQAEEATTLLGTATRLYEALPACTPTRFSVDTGTLAGYAITAYAASSYLSLGDFTQAERHARAALAVHEQVGAASRSPSREAIARLDLAIAQAHRHEPEEAAALGIQALGSSRVVDSVLARAAALDAALLTGHPELTCAHTFHEQYQTLTRC
jgi:tetratricopeptide (TPR) repeat protein/transcriptional regulator with XRE-family HTH domain